MLFRQGGESRLREARALLEKQRKQFPKAATRGDASALAVRVDGALGTQYGDEVAQQKVGAAAAQASGCPTEDDDRTAALNALLQMDAERAMPILKKVLARRDACSATLRRRAVFLVSQKRTPETEQLLLDVVRSDPDPEVRQQAVFWLSQVPGERATDVLAELLRTSKDEGVQDKAIFALSQQNNPRATQMLRQYAEQASAPERLRERAIFWLGQQGSAENAAFLRGLYGKLGDEDLKERTLFSLSQMEGHGNETWLLDVATNPRETLEMRKRALFWAGQSGGVTMPQLAALYDRTTDVDMKEQVIFVLSQRSSRDAVDKLIDIARREPNKQLRKRAIFWLSQSNDPRATALLTEIIEK
jgi:HEAT repeat protein